MHVRIAYIVLLVLVMIFPLPDADQKAAGKKEGLIDSLKHTHFSIESVAMILIGFTCTGTFQLWLNCAQNFAKENVGWADPSIMQTYYSAGTMLALVVTALLTRKIKDVRFILGYPVICLVTLIVVSGRKEPDTYDRRCIPHRMGRSRRTSSDRNFCMQHAFPEDQRNCNSTCYDRILTV